MIEEVRERKSKEEAALKERDATLARELQEKAEKEKADLLQ